MTLDELIEEFISLNPEGEDRLRAKMAELEALSSDEIMSMLSCEDITDKIIKGGQ